VNQKIDTQHLRQVALTRFDIQLLSLLMKTGGEYAMPETEEARALIKTTIAKNLVCVVHRPGENQRVRLTDEGRAVTSQLEAMAVQPKIEVVSK
jgi:hypothetical protein